MFKKSKKHFVLNERELCLQEIVRCEVDIAILQKLNPDTVVTKRPLGAQATQDVLAKEALGQKKAQLVSWQNRLEVVESML